RRVRFLDGSHSASVDLQGTRSSPSLMVASRTAFDGALLHAARAAGVRFLASRVAEVTRVDGGFEVRTPDRVLLRSRWLVGADGANSLVRRRLASPFSREQLSIATGFFVDDATSDEIRIEFLADPPGYIWSFPRPDHLAIGVCAQADVGATSAAL